MLDTPIAIFIFNRPDLTAIVFECIRQVKPKTLLVVADGPRQEKSGEIENCQKTRAITELIDWDCDVLRNYSEVNLSCGLRVSSGLDWVFEQVDRAIILEDDCLPNLEFFQFCEELLDIYKDENTITMISGMNYYSDICPDIPSYYFSCLPGIWGWATWKRAWELYDYEMKLFPKIAKSNYLDHIFTNIHHQKYWHLVFKKIFDADQKFTWDYQWIFAQWIHGGLAIVPHVNLVSNIGHGPDATHTKKKSKISNLPTEKIYFPLIHPLVQSRNLKMDDIIQKKFFSKNIFYRFLKSFYACFSKE
jgi:hypothetical protein